ncbi:hypothetical protein B566_EDAN014472 [Ephemera danica]|nr:hypothetical protein B566_EDAN014472 [Ephemera danica]
MLRTEILCLCFDCSCDLRVLRHDRIRNIRNHHTIKRKRGYRLPAVTTLPIFKFYSDDSSKNKVPREHPVSRTLRVLGQDFQYIGDKLFGGKKSEASEREDTSANFEKFDFWQDHCDIAIIGGGVIGSSIAYWIKQRVPKAVNVVVIEKDPTYSQASTTLSCGGLRQQFSLRQNIEMSQFGAQFLRECGKRLHVKGHDPPDVQFTPQGYLFLASAAGAQQLQENHELQMEMGVRNELLSNKQLKEKFPWLNTDDVELGCLGLENEGWFDPWSLLDGFKKKSISLGTKYVQGEAVGFEFKSQPDIPNGELKTVKFGLAVLACGPSSGKVAELARIGVGSGLLSIPLPVEPSPPRSDLEPSNLDFEVDHAFFEEHVWPSLAHRIPAMQALKVQSAWAGHYDYNYFDHNAILGPHPYHSNLYLATGFSGHGLQQAPAIGRAVMELIIDGGFTTIDLSLFSFDRFLLGNKVLERNIV